MIGFGFTPIKTQLGPLLNGMSIRHLCSRADHEFPGVDAFLDDIRRKHPRPALICIGFSFHHSRMLRCRCWRKP